MGTNGGSRTFALETRMEKNHESLAGGVTASESLSEHIAAPKRNSRMTTNLLNKASLQQPRTLEIQE